MIIGTMDLLINLAVFTSGPYSLFKSHYTEMLTSSRVSVFVCASLSIIAAAFLIFGVMKVS